MPKKEAMPKIARSVRFFGKRACTALLGADAKYLHPMRVGGQYPCTIAVKHSVQMRARVDVVRDARYGDRRVIVDGLAAFVGPRKRPIATSCLGFAGP
jgi:hypothetical protein